jgi:thiol-disulfide isomerase/thioredoxin
MVAFKKLCGDTILTKDGEVVDTEAALAGKGAVAFYFSAAWCPLCRAFTPQLASWYTKDLKTKGLEVVFVSADRDQKAFDEYYGEQPWLAMPFECNEKKALSNKFKVQGIPVLLMFGPGGQLITDEGRVTVSADPTGAKFPWAELATGRTVQCPLQRARITPSAAAPFNPIGRSIELVGLKNKPELNGKQVRLWMMGAALPRHFDLIALPRCARTGRRRG